MPNWETCSLEVIEAASDPGLLLWYVGRKDDGSTDAVRRLVERGRSPEWVAAIVEVDIANNWRMDFLSDGVLQVERIVLVKDGKTWREWIAP